MAIIVCRGLLRLPHIPYKSIVFKSGKLVNNAVFFIKPPMYVLKNQRALALPVAKVVTGANYLVMLLLYRCSA